MGGMGVAGRYGRLKVGKGDAGEASEGRSCTIECFGNLWTQCGECMMGLDSVGMYYLIDMGLFDQQEV